MSHFTKETETITKEITLDGVKYISESALNEAGSRTHILRKLKGKINFIATEFKDGTFSTKSKI